MKILQFPTRPANTDPYAILRRAMAEAVQADRPEVAAALRGMDK